MKDIINITPVPLAASHHPACVLLNGTGVFSVTYSKDKERVELNFHASSNIEKSAWNAIVEHEANNNTSIKELSKIKIFRIR